jgi:hypothetical protein
MSGWQEFVASLVASLAWPLVGIVLIVVFRHPIRSLLNGEIRRLRVGPFEAEWERKAGEVREQLVEAVQAPLERQVADALRDLPVGEQSDIPSPSNADDGSVAEFGLPTPTGERLQVADLMQVARVAPLAAVLLASELVQHGLNSLAGNDSVGAPVSAYRDPQKMATVLHSRGLIREPLRRAIAQMAELRNLAVHSSASAIDSEQAMEYVQLAAVVLSQLDEKRAW